MNYVQKRLTETGLFLKALTFALFFSCDLYVKSSVIIQLRLPEKGIFFAGATPCGRKRRRGASSFPGVGWRTACPHRALSGSALTR
jgi:hypothetical protein